MESRIICGLGNPGREYARSRHNIGWMLLEAWQPSLDYRSKFKGEYALVHSPVKLISLKPMTFMNKSGESLRSCADFFSVPPGDILVIHDDLELTFGDVQIKKGGGLGGHNGLKSIRQHLGTPDFYRLRFGIGRPQRGSVSDFVLSRFSKEEEAELPDLLLKGVQILEEFIRKEKQ
ncbi:aminoacyl-tRNA hydrolase [Marispirochaeta aestuarii]|uniref:aminoacyl-tRNA hydrolase n=1 Tax=Marispirochaeta aestuarii TaxID=1963862 RepID=UPI0029C9273A|nr:aminoacyl-tRNA hydrolase [Marispirochaeta aestuarii]